jgi:ribonuclease BN (tRNA processing enzyme)
MLEVSLIGTGTAIPVKGHSPASMLVYADGKRLLLDIGPGTLNRLEHAGIHYNQIDELLLTHFHPDHSLDLATLLLIFNYAPNASRTRPFTITGPLGMEDFLKNLYALYPDLLPIGYQLHVHPVLRDNFEIGKIKIQTAPTGHTPDSVAYRIEFDGHSVVYSGDAAKNGELVNLADGVELLISECSYPAGWETEDHLNAESLGSLAASAEVKSLVVTHCYPPALSVDLVGQIQQYFAGEVQMAYDGMHLTLGRTA